MGLMVIVEWVQAKGTFFFVWRPFTTWQHRDSEDLEDSESCQSSTEEMIDEQAETCYARACGEPRRLATLEELLHERRVLGMFIVQYLSKMSLEYVVTSAAVAAAVI